jgi:hypothetical protein
MPIWRISFKLDGDINLPNPHRKPGIILAENCIRSVPQLATLRHIVVVYCLYIDFRFATIPDEIFRTAKLGTII